MLDIDGCRDVTISDCIGDTDDDGITLKSTGPAPCENVVISNCVISSRCNAIKCGTESTGGFRRIAISNCVIKPSAALTGFYGHPEGIAAVALEIVDGGTMDGVAISNLVVEGTRSPFFIRLANRARPHQPHLPRPGIGRLRNISIQNVLISDAGDVGSSITGLPGAPVENVTLSCIRISNAVSGVPQRLGEVPAENAESYPEATMWGPLPASGFFVRHARGIRFADVTIIPAMNECRPLLVVEDVEGLQGTPLPA
jgi:polygalacturonase